MDIKGLPWYYGGMWDRLRETQIVVEREIERQREREGKDFGFELR